jgi:predicted metal-dependent hydrolase
MREKTPRKKPGLEKPGLAGIGRVLSGLAGKIRPKRPIGEASDLQFMSFSDRKVPVQFKTNRRARRIILRLDYGQARLVIVLPKRTSRAEGRKFAHLNRAWIAERIGDFHDAVPFRHDCVIPFLGEQRRVRHRADTQGGVWCEAGEIHVAGRAEHLPRRLRDWLKIQAKREIEASARNMAERIGKRVKRISIRDTKSRWGSCTSAGELSFSWRLVFAPPHVMDYVIAHEVAHLREMNHGPRFWKLCGELCGRQASARDWLENHGTDLYRYGR